MTFSLKAATAVACIALAAPAFAHGGHGGMDHMPSVSQTQTKTDTNTHTQTRTTDHHHDGKIRDIRHERELTRKIANEARVLLAQLLADIKNGKEQASEKVFAQLVTLNQLAMRDGVKVSVTVQGHVFNVGTTIPGEILPISGI